MAEQGEMVPAALLRGGERAAQQVGPEVHVGVGEHEPFADGVLVGLLQGVRLAEPAGGKGIDCAGLQPRITLRGGCENFAGRIDGAVVHRDDFVARIIECEKCFERGGKLFCFVACRRRELKRKGNGCLRSGAKLSSEGIDGTPRPSSIASKIHKSATAPRRPSRKSATTRFPPAM